MDELQQIPDKTFKQVKLYFNKSFPSRITKTLSTLDENNKFTINLTNEYIIQITLEEYHSIIHLIHNNKIKSISQIIFISRRRMVDDIIQLISNIRRNIKFQKKLL